MYELDVGLLAVLIEDVEFAKFSAKRSYGLEFQYPNEAKLFYYFQIQLTHWELLIYRYLDGLVENNQYSDWTDYYANRISSDMSVEWWNAVKEDYTQELVGAVEAAYAAK